jgi:multicomponent Na+:H+ antiporter subunit C
VEFVILAVVAALFISGIYLVLDRTLLRVVLGLGLLSNGTNLFLLASGGLEPGLPPILGAQDRVDAAVADALPQALILTAIVISFGVTALLLTISYRTYQRVGSDDLAELDGILNDE